MRTPIAAAIQKGAVADTTWTALVAQNTARRSLAIINETGADLYIAFAETAPSDVTTAMLLASGERYFEDPHSGVHITTVYAYQSSGGAVSVKFWEE